MRNSPKKYNESNKQSPIPADLTPEAAEKTGINLAMNIAIRQMQEGTASSQIITHFLKLGSLREQHEIELLKEKTAQAHAKTEQINSYKDNDTLVAEALNAFRGYSGQIQEDLDEEDLY